MNKRMMVGLILFIVVGLLAAGIGLIWMQSTKSSATQTSTGSICGGIAGIHCPAGYTCSYPTNANYPDAAGHCVLK